MPLLDGVRILDLTRATAGPFATQVLADLGAEVIKVEEPPGTPHARSILEPTKLVADMDPYFMSVNRNKKSVVLRLGDPEGLATFHRLVERADVVAENFRPGVARKLGVDHATLVAVNPRLISCSISGFGQYGPLSHRAAFDINVLAESGMLDFVGKRDAEGRLAYPMVPLADLVAGMYCAVAVPAAIVDRDRTGQGHHVDIAMYDATLSWFIGFGVHQLNFGAAAHYYERALWGTFPTADRPLVIAAHREGVWQRFCVSLGREEWLDDPRFAATATRADHIDELRRLIVAVLTTRPADVWIETFDAHGVSYAEVRTLAEVVDAPQTVARHMVTTVEHPVAGPMRLFGNPVKIDGTDTPLRPPPLCGEHTAEVLTALLDEPPRSASPAGADGSET